MIRLLRAQSLRFATPGRVGLGPAVLRPTGLCVGVFPLAPPGVRHFAHTPPVLRPPLQGEPQTSRLGQAFERVSDPIRLGTGILGGALFFTLVVAPSILFALTVLPVVGAVFMWRVARWRKLAQQLSAQRFKHLADSTLRLPVTPMQTLDMAVAGHAKVVQRIQYAVDTNEQGLAHALALTPVNGRVPQVLLGPMLKYQMAHMPAGGLMQTVGLPLEAHMAGTTARAGTVMVTFNEEDRMVIEIATQHAFGRRPTRWFLNTEASESEIVVTAHRTE